MSEVAWALSLAVIGLALPTSIALSLMSIYSRRH